MNINQKIRLLEEELSKINDQLQATLGLVALPSTEPIPGIPFTSDQLGKLQDRRTEIEQDLRELKIERYKQRNEKK